MQTFRIHIPTFLNAAPVVEREHARHVLARAAGGIPFFDLDRNEFLSLLDLENSVDRQLTPAHFTTSCLVFNPDFSRVLMVLHKKYQEWVTPGGHADGDWFWLRSALRECLEETGLEEVDVVSPDPEEPDLIVPHFFQRFAIAAFQEMPAHSHVDAVYFFRALSEQNIAFDPNESIDIRWFERAAFERVVAQRSTANEDRLSTLTSHEILRAFTLIDDLIHRC